MPYTSYLNNGLANTCNHLQGVHMKVTYIFKLITMCLFEIDDDYI